VKILSVNVARTSSLSARQEKHMTGIHKKSVSGPVMAGKFGMAGDEQADRVLHGGVNKAIYAYPSEHYPFWAEHRLKTLRRNEPLPPGSMGENLTILGLLEKDVWPGDRLTIGTVLLEITEPRSPCYKFGVKMGFAHAVQLMAQSGATGFYLKVVRPGEIQAGDAIALQPGPRKISIAQINDRRHGKGQHDLF